MAYQQQGQGYGQANPNPFGSQQGHGSIPPPSQPSVGYAYGSTESEEFREQYASEEDARRGELHSVRFVGSHRLLRFPRVPSDVLPMHAPNRHRLEVVVCELSVQAR